MKKILVTRKLLRSCEDKASKIFDVNLNLNDELYSQKKLIELSDGKDGILSSLTDKLDADTINNLPETIKIISNFAVGFGNIDLEAAKARGIAVTNTPEVLTDATAEIGILLILGACRRASEGIEASIPSDALLHAPRINRIPISAVASVKTSGVFVTAIPLAFAASRSIFPKPTAKFEIIFIVSGKLLIVSASSLSVKDDKIPSLPSLNSISFF